MESKPNPTETATEDTDSSAPVIGTYQTADASVRRTRLWTMASVLALVIVMIVFVIVQLRAGAWAAAIALSLALLTVGYVLGLLFAVPKSVSGESAPANVKRDPRHVLLVNTSFEQISDWLTKIIVGVGLVQFNQILAFTIQASKRVGAGLVNPLLPGPSANILALAIIIAFPALGLVLGFYSVRLYIAYAIYVTDERVTGNEQQEDQLAVSAQRPVVPEVVEKETVLSPPAEQIAPPV